MSLFNELKRRNVFKVAIAYVVVAWLAAQILQLVFESFGTPDWVMKTVLVLMVVGLLFALFFAWAFEMTPEGLKREHEVDRSQSITPHTGRKLNNLILVLMALAIAYFTYDKFVLSADREATAIKTALREATTQTATESLETPDASAQPDQSIAVLPFVNMSSDEEQEYFSDGLSEELLNLLASIPELRVIARTSSFAYKGKDVQISDVARDLKVAHVLEGSVRKAGDKVRITAQLIRASDSSHLWSQTYDRQLTDIFAIQDEISAAIVDALKSTLGIEMAAPAAAQSQASAEAYNEYLQGVYQMEQRGAGPLEKAIAHFERAIAIDPDYVPALARLSMSLNLYPQYASGLSRKDYIDKAAPYAKRAYELAPDHWEANLAMGSDRWQRAVVEGTSRKPAIEFFKRSVELNPSYGTSYAWLAGAKREEGDIAGSLSILEAAIQIAPLDRILLDNLAGGYIRRGRSGEAKQVIQRLLTVSPYMAHSRAAHLASIEGRWADNAIALIRKLAVAPESSNYWARRIVADDLAMPEDALTIGDEDSYCDIYIYLDQPERARECDSRNLLTQTGLARTYTEGVTAFLHGDPGKGRELMDQAWAQFDQSEQYLPGPEHIAARMEAGDEAGARELVEHLLKVVETRREAGIVSTNLLRAKGIAYYQIGEKDKALPLLEQTVEQGLFIRSMFPYQGDFRADPDIARLLERQRAKSGMERERFLEIMCGPDNPVPEYWQPRQESCSMLPGSGSGLNGKS